jgi:protease-4
MDEAIAKAAELAKLGEGERGLTYLEKEPSFADELMAAIAGEEETEQVPADALASLSPAPEALLARALGDVRAILSGPTIQARCLECPPLTRSPRLSESDRRWWASLLSWS